MYEQTVIELIAAAEGDDKATVYLRSGPVFFMTTSTWSK